MIRILLLGVLFLLIAQAFWRMVDGIVEGVGGGRSKRKRVIKPSMKLVKDPVCGTWVPPRQEMAVTRGGETHYFCSDACRKNFLQS